MDLFVPRRSNQPTDVTPKKEVPNGVATWEFNDLGARASCSCSRYHRAARKLFNISIIPIRTVCELCVHVYHKGEIYVKSLLHTIIKPLFRNSLSPK